MSDASDSSGSSFSNDPEETIKGFQLSPNGPIHLQGKGEEDLN
jgi:hypothetical protein